MPPRIRRRGLRSIRRIDAWHRGLDLVVHVYRVTSQFPPDERFGLVSQLRRAAIGIPSNLAEGVERETVQDRRRFITDSRSAIAEIETQLEAAVLLGFMTEQALLEVLEITDHLAAMLTNMRRNIREHPERGSRPSPRAARPTA